MKNGNFHAYTRDPEQPERRIVGGPAALLAHVAGFALYPGGPIETTCMPSTERLKVESPLWENGHSTILLNALHFTHEDANKGLVVISGGNGWTADAFDCGDFSVEWLKRGYNVLIWDYPGYGWSEGSPNYDSCIAGAQRIAEVAKELAGKKELWFYGTSLGGPHAAEMARLHPGSKLTLDRTFGSMNMAVSGMITRLLGPLAQWIFPYDTIGTVKKLQDVNMLIHWGTNDGLFGPEHGIALYQASDEKANLQQTDNSHNGRSPELLELLFKDGSHT